MQGRSVFFSLLCVCLLYVTPAAAELYCPGSPFKNGPEDPGVGPYDYYDVQAQRQYLSVVETHHFTPSVESLRRGSTGSVGQDLSYTLNSFPNHPRALIAMMNVALSRDQGLRGGMTRSPECFLDRAIKFRPKDARAREIYGVYLYKKGSYAEARKQFDVALSEGYDEPMFHYNFGLLLVKLKDWDAALTHARKAYQAGVSFPGLRRQLQEAGRWR